MSHNFNESSIYGVDDFKHKIHQLLSDRDTKSKLKARLRSEILTCSTQNGFGMKQNPISLDLDEKVVISLIYDYFKSKNLEMVLSVMLPSCGMRTGGDTFTEKDIQRYLNLENEKVDLKSLITGIRNQKAPSVGRDFGSQTDQGNHIGLEEKLMMIDHAYSQPIKQFDSTGLQEMHLKLEEQIKRGLESKTFSDIEKARELIRAEERIKFEQKLILERNEAEDKIRTLREEVLKKERRLHEDIKIRSDDIDRQSYNQRQHLLTELKRVQEKEGELHKLQIELSRKMMLFEEKEKSIEKLIKIRTDQKISEYDAQNCSEKEKTLIARQKAETILKEVTRQHSEMVEDKDEISRLRGETKRLTAELAAERAAHSSVQIESGELNSIRLKYNELMLELAQLKGEHSNLGVYRAQAKEVPTLRQTINTLSAKIMATEKELHKCKIELNSYKLNSSNIPIENKTQKDDQSEDSLLAKARSRWAEMTNGPNEMTSNDPSRDPQSMKQSQSKVKFDEETKFSPANFKPISSTPVPNPISMDDILNQSEVQIETELPDSSPVPPVGEIHEIETPKEKTGLTQHSLASSISRRSTLKPSSSRQSSPIPPEELSDMPELSLSALNDGNNTLDRIGNKTEAGFGPLDQIEKTVTPRDPSSHDPISNPPVYSQSEHGESQKSDGTEDQTYRSSKYSVDHSISLSAISGEFENQKSVEISTEHDSSDFDAGIRNFASDDRWKMGGGEQSFSSSNQKTDSIIEQMSVVSSKNDSW